MRVVGIERVEEGKNSDAGVKLSEFNEKGTNGEGRHSG